MKIDTSTLLFSLSRALDSVERELLGVTINHSKRAAYMALRVCTHLDMSAVALTDMAACTVLHDNALTEYIVSLKAQSLRRLENLHEHCSIGERNASHFPFLGPAAGIVLNHHENWDGSGFFGVHGAAISDRAAVLRLVDNVDLRFALGKGALGKAEQMLEHVQRERGTLYAPHVVDAFVACVDDAFLRELCDERIDEALRVITPSALRDIPAAVLLDMCEIFSRIIDAKSRFTRNHSQGIARLIKIMTTYYNLEAEEQTILIMVACLHDVGKLTVPNALLEKPSALTDEEFVIVKDHAAATYDILSVVEGFEDVARWAAGHHEKLDGSGYPQGLGRHDLPFETRLLTCVDIYQALTENRPYRQGMSHDKAIAVLRRGALAGKLDGKLVDDLDKVLGQLS